MDIVLDGRHNHEYIFFIGNIEIGINKEPLVIPEMGINHEGSLTVAKHIVDAAARAGAKIIKHQTHVVEDEMSHLAKKVIPGNSDVSIYDVMERCALSEEEEYELMQYVQSCCSSVRHFLVLQLIV